MTGHDPPMVAVESVTKRYESLGGPTVTALADISFEIARGEFVTVVGPTGCGKTTLIRILGGLDTPTSGRVRVAGDRVNEPSPDRSMVFQAYNLFPWLTVRENVGFGLVEQDVPTATRETKTRELLELVGLSEFADAYPKELSGGMKQRVGLARALAVEPSVLLMDEPFGSVDAQTRRHLQQELLDIWAESDLTVVFVTHDIQEAIRLGDRVLLMSRSPGAVDDQLDIDLSRPRNRTSDDFVTVVDSVTRRIGSDKETLEDHETTTIAER